MGCSSTREVSYISELKNECNKLMKENLDCISVIEYLLLKKNRQSLALRVISLKKRTEQYYEIIAKYRNFWISKTKKQQQDILSPAMAKCEKEQTEEKRQLIYAKEILYKIVEKLKGNWNKKHSNLGNLKESLESNSDILQKSASFYTNYYTENKEVIKKKAKELGKLVGDDLDIYEDIRTVTVEFYKHPEKRVYYTEDIEFIKKSKSHQTSKTKDELVIETKSLDESYNRVNDIEKNQSVENQYIDEESEYEREIDSSYLSSEDEETIRERLSYTQK
ncbi:hypothetical protein SteCoe_20423 [Stentor coeruleus]|uniref:Uncharacterized protein n=1 Tax=Stentor coeruleus TaxID=5963 RepID=A0A1R2BS59_9CILI|nr:hypothetical protein SteCoe_20423 [Stentor coeruleus]